MNPEIIVIDATVAIKWFVRDDEKDFAKAVSLRNNFLKGNIVLIAPQLLISETSNALRYKKDIDPLLVTRAIDTLWKLEIIEPIDAEISENAIDLAFKLDATIYDTTYLAMALLKEGKLVTADSKFRRQAAGFDQVLSLSEVHL